MRSADRTNAKGLRRLNNRIMGVEGLKALGNTWGLWYLGSDLGSRDISPEKNLRYCATALIRFKPNSFVF